MASWFSGAQESILLQAARNKFYPEYCLATIRWLRANALDFFSFPFSFEMDCYSICMSP